MQAFSDLDTCRQVGMSLGPIPWHFIRDYGRYRGLDDQANELFIKVMRTMDEGYRDWIEKNPPKDGSDDG